MKPRINQANLSSVIFNYITLLNSKFNKIFRPMPTYELFETHAHLDFNQFDADRSEVILRAREAGVTRIMNIGTSIATSHFSAELAQKHPMVYAAVGIHPHDSTEVTSAGISELRMLYQQKKVVAIGEIGLDYFRMYQPIDIQEHAFKKQLELALEINAPVIIHTRDSARATLKILKTFQTTGWNGVFHCFPGDHWMADTVLEMGFHISFTGSITFKNFKMSDVVHYIPLDRLLLETDCPFMTPVPHRGRRNEPAYVNFVGRKIAEIKGISFHEVTEQTTANARQLFNIQD